MFKTKCFSIISILAIAIVTSLFFHNCATIIKSECLAEQYNGTYSGEIKVSSFLGLEDEITVVVNSSESPITATFSSKLLNASLTATFLPFQNKFVIDPISVEDTLYFEDVIISGIEILSGTSTLDGNCDCLSFKINVNAVIDNSPIPPSHLVLDDPKGVEISTGINYLCRL